MDFSVCSLPPSFTLLHPPLCDAHAVTFPDISKKLGTFILTKVRPVSTYASLLSSVFLRVLSPPALLQSSPLCLRPSSTSIPLVVIRFMRIFHIDITKRLVAEQIPHPRMPYRALFWLLVWSYRRRWYLNSSSVDVVTCQGQELSSLTRLEFKTWNFRYGSDWGGPGWRGR